MKKYTEIVNALFAALVLSIFAIVINQQQLQIEKLVKQNRVLKRHQILVYKLDNYDGSAYGTVTDKGKLGNSYTIVIDGNHYAINRQEWLKIKKGDTVLGLMWRY